ncbi:FCD domain-containing protein [Chelatococcus sp. SYSU_G07232]|uniref:Pyruvate dehydrogenase complex repressor n=1 Tax=Chelatococcus albus TaxID=3047466 RepID=A0ABT7AEW7_9HYPH|nr:FCD domain-containing protein [Chelatococcus sp. SYSU_G07232]MDJ1157919.1 FCD domain-containing protein [Chelatococcus sp. SYSU_G07232]
MTFREIAHESKAEAVAHQIEALILEGVLRPRERLPGERELAERLDVSRPILREALKLLEARGLTTAQHGGGTFVADVVGPMFGEPMFGLFRTHAKAKADYVEFRRDIEAVVATYAAERATEADRLILTDILAAMVEAHDAGDLRREAELDVELHSAIAEATHNVVFMHVMRACYRLLADGIFYSRERFYQLPGARDALLAQHRALVEAVLARDAAAAGAAARAHIDYVRASLAEAERIAARESVAQLRLERHAERGHPGARQRQSSAVRGTSRATTGT